MWVTCLSEINITLLSSPYKEQESPSLESIEDEKNFAKEIPNAKLGFGLRIEDKALGFEFTTCRRTKIIFSAEEVYPNFPETTTRSPALPPFRLGILVRIDIG